jgi:hypothetical protein
MLTLKSKFADYFALIKGIACEDAVNPQSKIASDLTIGEVFAGYRDDPNFNEGWAVWCLETVGLELGEDIRLMIINKMKSPMKCLKLSLKCPFLSEKESTLLKGKYEGDKDVARTVICLEAIQKNREFNLVRVEAVASCTSVTDAKSLIESKTDVVTSVSADTTVKSSIELKEILESERAKMTEATKQVIVEQGFGGVAEFESWFEVA